jgi:hypothetical protein
VNGRALAIALLAATLAAGACGDGRDAPGGPLVIEAPASGAEVTVPFTVKVDSELPLGDPDDGHHYLRIYYDGIEDGTATDETFEVTDLSVGSHAIHVSLLEADGTLAGGEDEVVVDVRGTP